MHFCLKATDCSTVFLSVLTFVCEGLLLWSLAYHLSSNDATEVGLILSWLGVIPMSCACFAVLLLIFCKPDSPETRVESEMQRVLNPPNAPQR